MKINDRVTVKYIKQDKLKTGGISVFFCDSRTKERAYKNTLIQSVLSRGTENLKTAKAITERLQELYGSDIATNVDKRGEIQVVSFAADFVEEKFAPGMNLIRETTELIFDVIFNPLTENGVFCKSYFDREKENLNDYILSLKNEKRSYARMRLLQNMCENEAYGIFESGSISDGENLTNEELYDYYKNYFLKKMNVYIYICSKEEPTEILEYIKNYPPLKNFGERTEVKTGYVENRDIPYENVKHIAEPAEVSQAQLQIGFRANANPGNDEYYATAVMDYILGGSSESKLFLNVREKNSLAYYAASSYIRLKGLLIIYCGIAPDKYDDALDICLLQLKAIRDGDFTDEELQNAKANIARGVRSIDDTVFGKMNFSFNCDIRNEIYDDDVKSIEEYASKFDNVTREDVIEAAKRVCLDTVYLLGGSNE